jgi:hypothetical protein
MKPTLYREQSLDRIARHIHDAVTLGSPKLTLSGNAEIACDGPDDGGPRGWITVAHSYDLDAPSPGMSTAEVFDRLLTYWTTHSFRVLRDERPQTHGIKMGNTHGAIHMGLDADPHGNPTISASSPRIWPAGTPTPTN